MRIVEDRRQTLVNRSKGDHRYNRRNNVSIKRSQHALDRIDMDKLFKKDVFQITIGIDGETDSYDVIVAFEGVIAKLKELAKNSKTKFPINRYIVLRAIQTAFDANDVYISCTCPDFRYRFRYWCTINRCNSNGPEMRFPKITNPKDSKGAGCKHTLLVLGDRTWINVAATILNNYISYMKRNQAKLYDKYIAPHLFDVEDTIKIPDGQIGMFDKEVQSETDSGE